MSVQPEPQALVDFVGDLDAVMSEIRELLINKNRKYGNAALQPPGIFAKLTPIEYINVRIDDKLARKRSHQHDEDEDVDTDVIGYLLLKKIALLREDRAKVKAKELEQNGFDR